MHDGAKKLLLEEVTPEPEAAPAAPENPRHPKKKKAGPALDVYKRQGGKLYHSGAGVGAGGIAFGAHQLFTGAAGAVRCGAHRPPERRPTVVGDDEGVSPSACLLYTSYIDIL